MIRSFRNKALRRFFETGSVRGLSIADTKRLSRMVRALEAASVPDDLNLPGYHLHRLIGDQAGRYSIRVTANWRLTFAWQDEDAVAVDLEDYH